MFITLSIQLDQVFIRNFEQIFIKIQNYNIYMKKKCTKNFILWWSMFHPQFAFQFGLSWNKIWKRLRKLILVHIIDPFMYFPKLVMSIWIVLHELVILISRFTFCRKINHLIYHFWRASPITKWKGMNYRNSFWIDINIYIVFR